MNYKITITEIHKTVVDIEANSRDEALKRVEEEYWKNPNNYVLEPRDTYFEYKKPAFRRAFFIIQELQQ